MIRISFTVDGALHIPLSTKLGTKSKLFLFFLVCGELCIYKFEYIYIYACFFWYRYIYKNIYHVEDM